MSVFWPELGRVLWKKSRRGELHPREAVRILRAIDGLPLDVYPSEPMLAGTPLAEHVFWVGAGIP